ncbi:hypothetical protein JW899_01790 [Candidatus Uhrbacteria bacterium]|nr:hypothetical protein [Candidatus Uhrbacteria bacterium]
MTQTKPKKNFGTAAITAWTTVLIFALMAAMIGFTSWTVFDTLNDSENKPNGPLRENGATETVNERLMGRVEAFLDEKIGRSPTDPSILRNPFAFRRAAVPPPDETVPADSTPEEPQTEGSL